MRRARDLALIVGGLLLGHAALASDMNTDPDVKNFASAEYQTVLAHKKEIDELHTQLGK